MVLTRETFKDVLWIFTGKRVVHELELIECKGVELVHKKARYRMLLSYYRVHSTNFHDRARVICPELRMILLNNYPLDRHIDWIDMVSGDYYAFGNMIGLEDGLMVWPLTKVDKE